MYLQFFQLDEMPFNITPDPRFLYFSAHHREAYDHLVYGITQRKGFIELTGEVGCGKTTICRAVLASLGQGVRTALILNPTFSESQLLRAMLNDFGLTPAGDDRLAYVECLNAFLLQCYHSGQNVALLIDEAQDLAPGVLEQIRLLSNLETDQHKLIQIVLCGQPELKKRLDQNDLRQLRQRITVRSYLPPLTYTETVAYIHHRIQIAGPQSTLRFSRPALKAVHRHAKGCPRLINAVCDNALLAAYVYGQQKLTLTCVKKAIRQLEG
jgi:general secretion pathway protein A